MRADLDDIGFEEFVISGKGPGRGPILTAGIGATSDMREDPVQKE